MQKKTTLIFHIGNYSEPLQIIKKNIVHYWESVLATLIEQNNIAVGSPHSLRWWEGILYTSVWISYSSKLLQNIEIICNPYVTFFGWFDTGIDFKDPALVHLRSFDMNQQQTYRG